MIPLYQKIAAEAVQMDAEGAGISLMARHFGVDPKTVMKAIAWFRVGRLPCQRSSKPDHHDQCRVDDK